MILHHLRYFVALTVVLLASSPLLQADEAAAKQAAVSAMEKWLGEIDAGSFSDSWDDAAPSFQKAVTSAQCGDDLTKVRIPLGKILSRKLGSALYQTDVPTPNGQKLQGEFVIAQFDSSFENLKYARETVTFQKVGDTWKAAGYYIKPQ